jgi:hypothetical protein
MKHRQTDERFHLDPSKFPKRIDLDLSEEAVITIERLAARSGRSFAEVATDLLTRRMGT